MLTTGFQASVGSASNILHVGTDSEGPVLHNTPLTVSLFMQLSPECVAAAEGVDLVVVEGMGRAIETNLNATFSCDSLKLAMVKHPEVCMLCMLGFELSQTRRYACYGLNCHFCLSCCLEVLSQEQR